MRRCFGVLLVVGVISLTAGCAVRPTIDPRSPADVRGAPLLMRVCFIDGAGLAHLAVGDQVELSTNGLGRLRIRHLPGDQNKEGPNGGDDVAVCDAVLVETTDQCSRPPRVVSCRWAGSACAPAGGLARALRFRASVAIENFENDDLSNATSRKVPTGDHSLGVGRRLPRRPRALALCDCATRDCAHGDGPGCRGALSTA
jgi:hypothetical protein